MVGNKADYRSDPADDSRAEVDSRVAGKAAKELGAEYFECSAATYEGVEEVFKYVSAEFVRSYDETVSRAEDQMRGA